MKSTMIVFKFLFQEEPWCPNEAVHSIRIAFVKISKGACSDPKGEGCPQLDTSSVPRPSNSDGI